MDEKHKSFFELLERFEKLSLNEKSSLFCYLFGYFEKEGFLEVVDKYIREVLKNREGKENV